MRASTVNAGRQTGWSCLWALLDHGGRRLGRDCERTRRTARANPASAVKGTTQDEERGLPFLAVRPPNRSLPHAGIDSSGVDSSWVDSTPRRLTDPQVGLPQQLVPHVSRCFGVDGNHCRAAVPPPVGKAPSLSHPRPRGKFSGSQTARNQCAPDPASAVLPRSRLSAATGCGRDLQFRPAPHSRHRGRLLRDDGEGGRP